MAEHEPHNTAHAQQPSAAQQMQNRIAEMTPEQRKQLCEKLGDMPPERRAAVEEALRLYAAARREKQPRPAQQADTRPQSPAQQAASAKKEEMAETLAPLGKETKTKHARPAAKDTTKQAVKRQAEKPFAKKKQRAALAQAQEKKQARGCAGVKQWVQRFAESLQRGANDGALAEAREAAMLPPRLVYNAVGQLLYFIGLQTEYMLLRLVRTARLATRFFIAALGALMMAVLRPLGALARAVWHDITEPFARALSGLCGLARVMTQAGRHKKSPLAAGAAHLKTGARAYHKAALASLGYLLPVAAAAVFCLTVWVVLGNEYSLAVEYNGQFLGFVRDEIVWEDAQKMVRSRIRAAAGDEFTAYPELTVQSVNVAARSDASYLADKIVEASSDKIKNATGLYVGDELVSVCEDGKGVQRMLESALASGAEEGNEAVRTEFVQNVHTVAGVYLTSSLVSLAQTESDAVVNNWLQLKIIRTETYNEVLAFPTVEQESEKYFTGTKRVQQKGKDGTRQVTADIGYIDGVEVSRTELSSAVLTEATPKIVLVGTKKMAGVYDGPIQAGSGALMFPVPGYKYITTRFGQGGHLGVDICAPYGSPVYAADGGTVVTAGWHYSYGNYIVIDHGNGMQSLYAHNSALLVGVGANVSRGSLIAQVGSTGNSSGNHVHFELHVNGGRTDPLRYISPP